MSENGDNKLGLATCVAMIAGSMIGSAIFSLSGLTIYNAGPAAILTWIIAGAVMFMYGLVCAELSTRYPRSGGVFVFPQKAFEKDPGLSAFMGWISTWGYLNANIAAIAFAAIYIGTYLSVGFPIFSGLQVPLAIIAIIVVVILNSIRFSLTGKANNVMVICLVSALLIYIVTAFASGAWDADLLTPFFSQGAAGEAGFLASVPTAMVAYGSIVSIAFMVSEVKDPNKTIPRSMVIAMIIVMALYLGVIVSTVGMVTAEYLTENPGMQYIPLYAAAFSAMQAFPWMSKVISIAAVLALITTMLIVMSMTARAIQASSECGVLPAGLSKINRYGVPMNACIFIAVPCAVISCFPGLTSAVVSLGALFAAITISINCISLMVSRRRMPLPEGAFKAPGGNVLPVLAMALIVICYIPDVISGGWLIWLYTIVWYAVGMIYFRLIVKAGGRHVQ